jgi:ATP-dependent helicase/nuclease subunit A
MTSERKLADQSARDRIIADLDRNLLVEAGAGSGKTHEMASRMAAGIAAGLYQVEHMSAVTFTRKAAAELRGRFQLALEDGLRRNLKLPNDSDRIARIHNALSNLERFFAGTIHSFCAHLLRERPVEAGVSPGFTEVDEAGDALLRKQSWRDFLTATKAAGDANVATLLKAGIEPRDLDTAFETVCLYEEVEFPPGETEEPDTRAGFNALDRFWTEMCKKLPTIIAQDTTCTTQKIARRFYGQMRIAKSRSDRPGTLAELLTTWNFEPTITQKWWADDTATKKKIAAEVMQLHTAFRTDVIGPYLATWRQYIYRLSIPLLTAARAYAAHERRRRNTLNYGDLLQLAARVLRGNAEVRHSLQTKYKWLFVDEFQDTDPVQAEIIFLLAGEDPPISDVGRRNFTNPVDWRSIPLRGGALFVVGDPKQSIFRFRRADIDIYNVVRERLSDPSSGQVVSLTSNFRSVPILCEWANDVFRQQFPSESTAYSPKFAPLDANRANKGDANVNASGVYTLTVPASVDQKDVPASEADLIARYIRSEADAKRRSFGDFLVLTRKKKQLASYVKALENLQVPFDVSGAGAFGGSQEVAHLALLLRALSDPQDGVSLIGVLRGPLFGVSDQDLFTFRHAGGWFSVFKGATLKPTSQAGVSNGALQACTDALKSLHQMFRWTRVLPVGAAVERILDHTGYLALAATTPESVEAGDLLHAIDRVRQVIADGHSLAVAASALEEDLTASGEVESLPLEPGRGDVVRIMNVHKAKGLEAPVVFLADPCGGSNTRADVRIIREGLVAHGYFPITNKVGEWGHKVVAEPAGWETYEEQEQTYLAAEEHRLLYVAATRARDMLIVGRWAKSGGSTVRAWGAFTPFLGGMPELPVPVNVSTPAPHQVADLSAAENTRAAAMRTAAHNRARLPSWSANSVADETRHLGRLPRSQESADDPTRAVIADTSSHRADAGLAWGALIHGLLEHSMRHQAATRDDLRRLAMWLTVEEPQLRIVIDEALETVEAMAQTAFWKKAQSSEHYVEVPFCIGALTLGQKELRSGIVDLVHRADGQWNVVDYKTDRNVLISTKKYDAQLEAYREMWQKMTGCEVRSELVSTRVRPPRADGL